MMKNKRFAKWVTKGTSISEAGICWRFTYNKVLGTKLVFTKNFWDWFRLCTQLNRKGNQPGFCMSVDLLWFRWEIELYDRRHWDHKNNRFRVQRAENFEYF
jgi:hypothetical protein